MFPPPSLTPPARRARGAAAALTLGALLASSLTLATAPAANAAESLLSQGRPATASSSEGEAFSAAAAVDGNLTGTRWASQWSDAQWFQVDLGASRNLSRTVLTWEGAYGRNYEIQVSDNGTDWRTAKTVTGSDGGTDDLAISGSGRYVRMNGLARSSGYGYSLWEFQVYGESGGTNPPQGAVRVTGSQGNWQLTVGGQPYTVKGLTWGPAIADAPRYMPDLKSMGVNTIRTWGTDGGTKPLLDTAAAHGIRVVNGFWLQPGGGPGSGGCVNYVTDTAYKNTMLTEFAKWVDTYKSHPATLMWNVGNESVLGLQNCYSGTELEAQRNAYASFVNDVARKIHSIDPDHPVTSTDAWTGAWPYYKRNAPDLDLYSMNAYGDICGVRQDWIDGGYDKPYIITETGNAGEWEVPDDVNGIPDEPTDVQKAEDGRGNAGIETKSVKVVAPPITGTNIAQGRPTTASSSQASYGDCPCPASNATDGDTGTRWASDWSDPQWLQVDLGSAKPLRTLQLVWDPAYARSYEVQVSDDGQSWRTIHTTTTGNGDIDTVETATTARYVKLQLTARGTGWGYSLHEFGVYS